VSAAKRGSDEPVRLRDAIAAFGRRLGMPEPNAISTLANDWPEIVGAALAAHSSVRAIRDGVCTVEVDDAGWATQVRYAESQLLERVRERCGAGVVDAIRVVVARR